MTSIDQHTVELLGGASPYGALCPTDAAKVLAIMEKRLMIALCMETAPTAEPDLSLWKQLLSSAITVYSSLDYDGVKSEHVRNYSYTLSNDSGKWGVLYNVCGDLLAYFNKCKYCGISMQTDVTWWLYSEWSDKVWFPVGGAI